MSSATRQRKRRSLVRQHGEKCAHCGKKTKNLTLDHIIPQRHGGPHALWNLQLLCRRCNLKKGCKVDVSLFFFRAAA